MGSKAVLAACFATLVISNTIFVGTAVSIEGVKQNSIKDEQDKLKPEFNAFTKPDGVHSGRSLHSECGSGNITPKCLKIQALSFIEDISSREELSLLPGLSIVKEQKPGNFTTPEEMAAELTRSFPGRPDEKLNRYLLYRIGSYLDGHSLKYKLLDTETAKEAMDVANDSDGAVAESGRKGGGGGGGGFGGGGGKKGDGGLGSLIAMGMMLKGTLLAAGMAALALLAGKALMTALMALLLAALSALKGSGGGGHKSTTYEIISKPVVSHAHTQSHEEFHEHDYGHGGHGHSGYRRSYR